MPGGGIARAAIARHDAPAPGAHWGGVRVIPSFSLGHPTGDTQRGPGPAKCHKHLIGILIAVLNAIPSATLLPYTRVPRGGFQVARPSAEDFLWRPKEEAQ